MKKALIGLAIVAFVVAGAAQPAFAQQEEDSNEVDEEIEVEQGDNEAEIEREGEIYLELKGNVSQSNEATLIATREGEPVANATVEVYGEEVGTTDSNGELEITIPDLREFEIEVETEELEGSIEVEIETEESETEEAETEESETEEAEREDEETQESENESQGNSAQFDARLGTAIRTVDALIEIAPNDEAEQGLQNALDELRTVQNNTDTASLGSEEPDEETENESEEPGRELGEELGQEGEEGASAGPPGTRGPSENENRPGFVNQMLGGIFG